MVIPLALALIKRQNFEFETHLNYITVQGQSKLHSDILSQNTGAWLLWSVAQVVVCTTISYIPSLRPAWDLRDAEERQRYREKTQTHHWRTEVIAQAVGHQVQSPRFDPQHQKDKNRNTQTNKQTMRNLFKQQTKTMEDMIRNASNGTPV